MFENLQQSSTFKQKYWLQLVTKCSNIAIHCVRNAYKDTETLLLLWRAAVWQAWISNIFITGLQVSVLRTFNVPYMSCQIGFVIRVADLGSECSTVVMRYCALFQGNSNSSYTWISWCSLLQKCAARNSCDVRKKKV